MATTISFEGWCDFFEENMPQADREHFAKKFKEEAQEFVENPCLEELADCFATLYAWVAVNSANAEEEINFALRKKLKKNLKRKWRRMSDGTYHHIK